MYLCICGGCLCCMHVSSSACEGCVSVCVVSVHVLVCALSACASVHMCCLSLCIWGTHLSVSCVCCVIFVHVSVCVSVCMQKHILYIHTRVQACPLLGAMDPEMSEKSSESQ